MLNSTGRAVETISGSPINGPWDMTSVTDGQGRLYVADTQGNRIAAVPHALTRQTPRGLR